MTNPLRRRRKINLGNNKSPAPSKRVSSDADFIEFIAGWDERNPTAIKLLSYLYRQLDSSGRTPEISIKEICSSIKRERSAVFKAKDTLKKQGLLFAAKEYGEACEYQIRIYGQPVVRDSE